MKEIYDHKLTASFLLWFDNYLLNKGQAYTNENEFFYPSIDDSLPGFAIYASPYKQIVYDSSVIGANIMSGVYPINSNVFLERGQSGIKIDYSNGRVFADTAITGELYDYVTGNYGSSPTYIYSSGGSYLYSGGKLIETSQVPDGYYYFANVGDLDVGSYSIPGFSGAFARKEFNIYPTDEDNFGFILEQVKDGNKDLQYAATGVDPYIYAAPCCVVSLSNSENTPFSFGGQDTTQTTARVMVISKNRWQQDGILGLFRDAQNRVFPLIPSSGIPLDFYGDLKYGYYNYSDLSREFCSSSNIVSIDSVYSSKISEKATKGSSLFLSFIEFELKKNRYTRLE